MSSEIKQIIKYLESKHLGYYNPKVGKDFNWRITLDSNQKIKNYSELERILHKDGLGFNMAIAETIHINKQQFLQIKKVIKVQNEFIKAINDITKLSLKDNANNYKFSRYIRNIVYYDIERQSDRELVRDLILTCSTPICSARADILSNGKITEMQIASAGWNEIYDLYNSIPGGEKCKILQKFYETQQKLTLKDYPIIVIYINDGVSSYWDQMADFADALNEAVGKRCAYVAGTDGLKYINKKLYYIGTNDYKISVDSVYSLGDIRRVIKEGNTDVLQAALDSKIVFQPTINPLLNNYQLALSLLNNELTAEWFKYRLGLRIFNRIKKCCVEYFAIASSTNFGSFLEGMHADLRTIPLSSVISRRKRSDFMYRLLLTKELSIISGGWGIERLSYIKNNDELNKMVENSMSASVLLSSLDKAEFDQALIGLSRYYRSRLNRSVKFYRWENDKEHTYLIDKPTVLFEVFCIDSGGGLEYEDMYVYYSDPQESGFHIGGSKRALGCVSTKGNKRDF